VKQTLVNVLDDTPNPGSFTYQVTVKNVGGATAKSVQEVVYPFRGGHLGNGHRGFTDGVVGDTDPRAQMSAVLVFPDLSPGQENTQAAVFLADPDINPGLNPNPQISFISAKGP
jgi:hypothetical protein